MAPTIGNRRLTDEGKNGSLSANATVPVAMLHITAAPAISRVRDLRSPKRPKSGASRVKDSRRAPSIAPISVSVSLSSEAMDFATAGSTCLSI